ncbi:DUF427 domain-containing protein [Streptomyces sp. XM4193]|uniref:DUF427 domain-containing protein n=1 Tax=Streptomyces sp. XM4193 TaxID=2929782 RepID=UPI001FF9775A|nr:DUF427 domain-containing protein [Streptomyces sp. XM4193]MCK1798321.1 DUF427 domain-containing protein [Streptomyces sp. XM4193]
MTAEPAGAGRVRVTWRGAEIADSARPLLLTETGYPDRYYLPPEDVRTAELVETERRTHCPFKGDARYWAPRETPGDEIAWSYPSPKPLVAAVRDHLCFCEGDDVRIEILPN